MKDRLKHLILFILLIAIDQVTKFWVRTELINSDPIVIIPNNILNLQYHTNNGAVWGLMGGKVDFLKIFTFIVLLLIAFFYTKIPQGKKFNVLKVIIVFIMAGAVGNLIDRIYLNYVVDFIYVEIINFPLFNFADIYLTMSSILLFILAIFYFKDDDFAFIDGIFKKKKATVALGKSTKDTSDMDSRTDSLDETISEDETDFEDETISEDKIISEDETVFEDETKDSE